MSQKKPSGQRDQAIEFFLTRLDFESDFPVIGSYNICIGKLQSTISILFYVISNLADLFSSLHDKIYEVDKNSFL